MVARVRDILAQSARGWGLGPATYLTWAREGWTQIVGVGPAAFSAPLTIRRRVLVVGVTHPAAAQEIRLRKGAILAVLAREFGADALADVAVVSRRRLPTARGGRSEVRWVTERGQKQTNPGRKRSPARRS